VVLNLDSTDMVVIKGDAASVTYDIALYAQQPMLEGLIKPHVGDGTVGTRDRQYVPARALANAFGIPIDFATGTVILG